MASTPAVSFFLEGEMGCRRKCLPLLCERAGPRDATTFLTRAKIGCRLQVSPMGGGEGASRRAAPRRPKHTHPKTHTHTHTQHRRRAS